MKQKFRKPPRKVADAGYALSSAVVRGEPAHVLEELRKKIEQAKKEHGK